MVGEELVYTTPNPRLAYDYACLHQLFGNGFLMRVVLDVRVQRRFMARQFNLMHYNWETLYNPEHAKVAGARCGVIDATTLGVNGATIVWVSRGDGQVISGISGKVHVSALWSVTKPTESSMVCHT